jgi:hypothetical protein
MTVNKRESIFKCDFLPSGAVNYIVNKYILIYVDRWEERSFNYFQM